MTIVTILSVGYSHYMANEGNDNNQDDSLDLNGYGSGDPLDPNDKKSMSETLALYKKALEEEFNLTQHPELANPEKLAEKAREKITMALPKAIATITEVAENGSSSDNTRLNASKYIVDLVIGKYAGSTDDPMTKLLNDLTKPQPVSDEATKPVDDGHN